MKIKTWIKYEESYVPPRCRKLRYRECEDYINVNLKEVASDEMRLAFEDNFYSGKGKIYYYKGKLWSKVKSVNFMCNPEEHGIKTPLEELKYVVEYHYNPNIRNDNYFAALDGKKAVEYANSVAAGRGDTNDVGRFKELIIVHMPELVKVKPKKQHGEGNKFLNDVEDIINGSGDALTAGLLCMSLIAHEK